MYVHNVGEKAGEDYGGVRTGPIRDNQESIRGHLVGQRPSIRVTGYIGLYWGVFFSQLTWSLVIRSIRVTLDYTGWYILAILHGQFGSDLHPGPLGL